MKHYTKLTLAASAALLSSSVFAASFDLRHEYKHDTEQHATRVKLADNIGNFLVDIEAKFKGEEGKFMEELKNNGWELGLNYRHNINDQWTLTYGMPIEARPAGITYKPQIRATYAVESVDGLSLSARYRYDIRQNNDTTEYIEQDDGGFEKVEVRGENERRHRFTANINYALNDYRFGFEGNYYKADGYDIFDNGETNYELNATARKIMGQWAPYVEFGDVNVNAISDQRELRSRVGLTYSF